VEAIDALEESAPLATAAEACAAFETAGRLLVALSELTGGAAGGALRRCGGVGATAEYAVGRVLAA
jgi:hypothetical protein